MNIKKLIEYFGSGAKAAKQIGVDPSTLSRWGAFGTLPKTIWKDARKALKRRKKQLDRLYDDLIK